MNVTRTDQVPALREAFYELSLAMQVPDAETLDEVCRHYPHYCAELTEFAIALALDALTGDVVSEAALAQVDPSRVSPMVSRAISNFHNRLHSAQKASIAVAEKTTAYGQIDNPFAKLTRSEIRAVANQLHANTVFVAKLRDRQIIPQTIPDVFVRRVADELSVPHELVIQHFAGQGGTVGRTFHKADGKPSIGGQQSFDDAVRSSGLTEEQQKRLLSI
jgi:hypothetical protein